MNELEELAEEIETCTKCDLHKDRTNSVPGEGPSNADIMLIGEAPGYHEDQEGRPFVGKAGDILTELLERAGFERSDVFIGNVLKCRPPENRDPTKEEIETCMPYLERQVRIIKPRLIIPLGRIAAKTLLGRSVKVSEEHGEVKNFDFAGWNCKILISYHPAATLYGRSKKEKLERDFDKIKEIINELLSSSKKGSIQQKLI